MSLFLIAEIRINHNGDIATAKQLVDAARNVGFDTVEFQKLIINVDYSRKLLDSSRDSPWGAIQRELNRVLNLKV